MRDRMKNCGLRIADCGFHRAARCGMCLVLCVLAALCPQTLADEMLYLQSGEEYAATIEKIADGQLSAVVAGEAKTFPLDQVQRIEFQRRRLYDGVRDAAGLEKAADLFGRALTPKTEDLAKQFPQASYVVLFDETVVTLAAEGRYTAERTRAWRLLQERGARSASRSIRYFPGRETLEIVFGLTIAPDGSAARVADTAMLDEAIHARLPEYNFRHRLRFNLKNAVPGATFVLRTRKTGKATLLNPLARDWVFWETEPVLQRSVRLVAPADLAAKVSVEALNGLKPAGDGLWQAKDCPQVFHEPLMPPFEAFAPRLVLAWPKATWPEIAKALHERAGGEATLEAKGVPPRGLFDHVRLAIRLERVLLESQPDGPARPEQVLNRGFGNEVEKALLLAALLRGAGSRAEVVLARGRNNGPLVAAVPRLKRFVHALVRMTDKDGTVAWLQPDNEDRGFGEIAGDAQGSEGLNLSTGEIVTVPVLSPANEAMQRTVEIELATDGTANVRDSYKLHGYSAMRYRPLRNLTQDQLGKWAARFVGSEVTGVDLLAFNHSDFGNANAEERLTLAYRVPALAEKAGDFLVLRLPNARLPASDVGRSTRERDLSWERPNRDEITFVIRAPSGYTPYALGDKLERSGEGWSVKAGFAADPASPGVVTFHDTWERSALGAPRAAYDAYRQARILRSRLRSEVLVFVKQGQAAPKP